MTSPLLDEMVMIDALEKSETEQQHGSGILMMLIDAWDRKVTRDQFIAACSSAVTCADNLGRCSVAHNIKAFLIRNQYDISPADIETAVLQTGNQLKSSTEECLKMARLLSQCPMNEDTIQ